VTNLDHFSHENSPKKTHGYLVLDKDPMWGGQSQNKDPKKGGQLSPTYFGNIHHPWE